MLVQPSTARMPRSRWLDVLPDYVVHDYAVEHEMVDADGDAAAALHPRHRRSHARRVTVMSPARRSVTASTTIVDSLCEAPRKA